MANNQGSASSRRKEAAKFAEKQEATDAAQNAAVVKAGLAAFQIKGLSSEEKLSRLRSSGLASTLSKNQLSTLGITPTKTPTTTPSTTAVSPTGLTGGDPRQGVPVNPSSYGKRIVPAKPDSKINSLNKSFQNNELNEDFTPKVETEAVPYFNSPTNIFGDELPDGALGWMPNNQPDWGPGLKGWAVKTYNKMTGNSLTELFNRRQSDWDAVKNSVENKDFANAAQNFLSGAGKLAANVAGDSLSNESAGEGFDPAMQTELSFDMGAEEFGKQVVAGALEVVSKVPDLSSAFGSDSPVTPFLKLLDVGVSSLMQGFDELAKSVPRGYATMQGVDSAGADSPLPDIDLFGNVPIIGYDLLRMLTAPGTWEQKADIIRTEGETGRILYSQIAEKEMGKLSQYADFDWSQGKVLQTRTVEPYLKEEFIRRYKSGEDPRHLKMELENPLAELVGELIFDPMNVFGWMGKLNKIASVSDDASDLIRASGTVADPAMQKLVDELPKLAKTGDDNAIAQSILDIAKVHGNTVEEISKGKMFVQGRKATSRAATSMRKVAIRNIGDTLDSVASVVVRQGGDAEDVALLYSHMAMAASPNEAQRAVGVAGMLSYDNGRQMLSQPGTEAQIFLRKMLTNDAGEFKPDNFINLVRSAGGDTEKVLENLAPVYGRATENMFPTVSQMRAANNKAKKALKAGRDITQRTANLSREYDSLSEGVKFWSRLDESVSKPKKAVNSVLGFSYFTANPGYAMRNFTTDTFVSFMDNGFQVFDGGNSATLKQNVGDWYGFDSRLGAGFGEVGSESNLIEGISTKGMSAVAESFESKSSLRILNKHAGDSMKKFLQEGMALPKMDNLRANNLTDEALDYFTKSIYDRKGDVTKAAQDLRDVIAEGGIDTWRATSYLTPKEHKYLDALDGYDEFAELQRSGASKDDVSSFFQKAIDNYAEQAAKISLDPSGVSQGHPAEMSIKELAAAFSEGYGNKGENRALEIALESAHEAKAAATNAISEGVVRATENIAAEFGKGTPEVTLLVERQKNLLAYGESIGQETGQASRRFTENIRSISDEAKSISNWTDDDAVRLWQQAGAEGLPPLEASRQEFTNALWQEHFYPTQRARWFKYYDGFNNEYKKLAEVVIPKIGTQRGEGIQELFARSEKLMARAQEMRSSVFSAGRGEVVARADIAEDVRISLEAEKKVVDSRIQEIADIQQEEFLARRAAETADPLRGGLGDLGFTDEAVDIGKVDPSLPDAEKLDIKRKTQEYEKFLRESQSEFMSKELQADLLKERRKSKGTFGGNEQRVSGDVDRRPEMIEKITKDKKELGNLFELSEGQQAGRERQVEDIAGSDFFAELQGKVAELRGDDATKLESELKELTERAGKIDEQLAPSNAVTPPYISGSVPTPARSLIENNRGMLEMFANLEKRIYDDWGQQIKVFGDAKTEQALADFVSEAIPRIDEARDIARKTGEYWRDLALHFYGDKRYADLALSYLQPFNFWHSRTYNSMFKRLTSDPRVFSAFAKYRSFMDKANADAPEWYRYNVKIENMMGVELDDPLYFNLESSLWPLNGLTGIDYNDPYKRTGFVANTIDDLGKFGPSNHALINLTMATALSMQGQEEAAAHWGNRLFRQTKSIKNISAATGLMPFGKPIELDPAVLIFSDGLDPTERNKIHRALAGMSQNGEFAEEEIIDAANSQEGQIWDEAVRRSLEENMTPQLMSLVGGVGYKPRTKEDMETDRFYQDYRRMLSMSDFMSPDEFRESWGTLKNQYPFMDALLLSKKGDDERNRAYAYNVLSRVPPGQTDDYLEIAGIRRSDVNRFYDSKGDVTGWSEGDYKRFTGAISDLGAMFKMPTTATKESWAAAKDEYANISDDIEMIFGGNINDEITAFYDLKTGKEKEDFLALNPHVEEALDYRTERVVTNPIVFEYYGSLDAIDRYVTSTVYYEVEKKLGKSVVQIYNFYSNIDDPEEKKKFGKANRKELDAYYDTRNEMLDQVDRAVVRMSERLPEQPPLPTRPDFPLDPESATQAELFAETQQEAPITWTQFQNILSEPMQRMLVDYWINGEVLDYAVVQRLNDYAKDYGFKDGNELNQLIGMSLR